MFYSEGVLTPTNCLRSPSGPDLSIDESSPCITALRDECRKPYVVTCNVEVNLRLDVHLAVNES